MQNLKRNLTKVIKVSVPYIGIKEYRAVKPIFISGKFVSGKNVKHFEEKFSKYINTKYACAVNSGTAALHTALRCLNLKKNDEVIVPAISFMSTATSVIQNGNIPIFCDVNLSDYCLDVSDLKKKITKKTKAIIVVHFTGNVCDMDKIIQIAKNKKIKIIEDCAQSHGSKYKGERVGSFGDISCFSFYATKHMTTGEGGILCHNNKTYDQISKQFINHGLKNRDEHEILGFNYRMNEMSAVIGLEQLKNLDKFNKVRIKNSLKIINELKKIKQDWFEIQELKKNCQHTFFWLPIRIKNKKIKLSSIIKYFRDNGVELRHRYKYPLYKHPLFKKIKNSSQNYSKVFLKNSEMLAGNIFGLPNHYKLKKKEINLIVDLMKNLEHQIG